MALRLILSRLRAGEHRRVVGAELLATWRGLLVVALTVGRGHHVRPAVPYVIERFFQAAGVDDADEEREQPTPQGYRGDCLSTTSVEARHMIDFPLIYFTH